MIKKIFFVLFFCLYPVWGQESGVHTMSGIGNGIDQNYLYNYTSYSSNNYAYEGGNSDFYVQVLYNSPDYIQRYFSDFARYAKLSKAESIHLIERNFSYARRYIWFDVTIRSNRLEDLLWTDESCFILEKDGGSYCGYGNYTDKVKPMLSGRGTIPQYCPIEVDGHVYDFLAWEKTFGLKFPASFITEETSSITLKSPCWGKILGTWKIDKRMFSQYQGIR